MDNIWETKFDFRHHIRFEWRKETSHGKAFQEERALSRKWRKTACTDQETEIQGDRNLRGIKRGNPGGRQNLRTPLKDCRGLSVKAGVPLGCVNRPGERTGP